MIIYGSPKIEKLKDMKELTKEVAKKLEGQKVEIHATKMIDFYTAIIQGVHKIFIDKRDDTIWLLKPRATRKGQILSTLDNPMYKPINN